MKKERVVIDYTFYSPNQKFRIEASPTEWKGFTVERESYCGITWFDDWKGNIDDLDEYISILTDLRNAITQEQKQ